MGTQGMRGPPNQQTARPPSPSVSEFASRDLIRLKSPLQISRSSAQGWLHAGKSIEKDKLTDKDNVESGATIEMDGITKERMSNVRDAADDKVVILYISQRSE
jgi:hypothetical protein